ncbi:MAG: sigma-70 family RNA polymerase sigma factor [Candidatus Thioglobus sp.]|nr:sigma-70 family RNA polymerase sigma factor [Candidatus Thioglobus sp.]
MQKHLSQYFQQLQRQKTQRNFKKVFECSNVQLFGVIIRILKQKEISEDCLQEVYVKIWHKIDSYIDAKSSPMTWMSAIARNHAIDYIRKRKLPIQDDFELAAISDEQLDFLQELEARQTNRQLQECLQQLKPEVMNVLLLAYFNGLTYQSIAKTLKVPVNTIKTWIRRALPVLKKCLENFDD